MPNSKTRWFGWLKHLFGFGKQTVPRNLSPTNPAGGIQFNARAAVREFGETFIGVVEIGPQGSRVTAGTYAKNANHLTLSKQNLGRLESGHRRFGFSRNPRGITIGPSSTGAIPTIGEIPAIRAALGEQGYLIIGGLHIIVTEDRNGELHAQNLLTGEAIS